MGVIIAPGVIQVKGKIGGYVYYGKSKKKFVKSYSAHKSTHTSAQDTQRVRFKEAKDAWNALTFEEVLQWKRLAYAAAFRSGGYQYFIHCYLKGIEPVPADHSHLIVNKIFTPGDLLQLSSQDLPILFNLSSNKYIRPRSLMWFCNLWHFDNGSLSVNVGPVFNVCEILLKPNSPNQGIASFSYDLNTPTDNYTTDFGIYLSNGLSGINDYGGSSDFCLSLEYSLLDWFTG